MKRRKNLLGKIRKRLGWLSQEKEQGSQEKGQELQEKEQVCE